jgi:hypothetical protein
VLTISFDKIHPIQALPEHKTQINLSMMWKERRASQMKESIAIQTRKRALGFF